MTKSNSEATISSFYRSALENQISFDDRADMKGGAVGFSSFLSIGDS